MRMLPFVFALAVALAAGPGASRAIAQPADPSSYILFLHIGTADKGQDTSGVVNSVTAALLKAGYSLRAPDADRDVVGGPGVDYFDDADANAAAEVANTINTAEPNLKLKPRRQRAKTPPHYIGIWLF